MDVEKTLTWEELTEHEASMAVAAHKPIADVAKKPLSSLRRLFELGRPKIVFGPGYSYCRIHKDSVDVMKVITNEYLCKPST